MILLRWLCRKLRQMNLQHASWDVWRLLEPSSDALLGLERAGSGTCCRPSPKKFWRIAMALRELAFGRCRRTGTQPSDTQCLWLDHDVNFTA